MKKVRVGNKPSAAAPKRRAPRRRAHGDVHATPTGAESTRALVERMKATLTDIGRPMPMRDPISELEDKLTPPQVHTIIWLGVDGPQSQSEVAQRIHCSSPTMTGIVDRLERDGYVERVRDAVDRRVARLHLTEKGKAIFAHIDETMTTRLEALFSIMKRKDCVGLVDILGRMVSALRKVGENMGVSRVLREESKS